MGDASNVCAALDDEALRCSAPVESLVGWLIIPCVVELEWDERGEEKIETQSEKKERKKKLGKEKREKRAGSMKAK